MEPGTLNPEPRTQNPEPRTQNPEPGTLNLEPMYIPHHYKNENLEEVKEFIRANAFGILVNELDGRPWATHIPLELEDDGSGGHHLLGHISRANPQWQAFGESQQVLCIFNGPHAYVSSSWYGEEEVPTWDYIAVHIYGTLRILDETALYEALDKLITRYESNSRQPLTLAGLSGKTLRQIRGVVGFKISVEEIQAAYKLSQGRPEDHENIIRELDAGGDPAAAAVAQAIRKHGKTLPK